METVSALLILCKGTPETPPQKKKQQKKTTNNPTKQQQNTHTRARARKVSITRIYDEYFVVSIHKLLNKQSTFRRL